MNLKKSDKIHIETEDL